MAVAIFDLGRYGAGMKTKICALLLTVLLCPTSRAQDRAAGDVGRYVWDLTPLYANDEAWEAERRAITAKIAEIGRLRGTVGRDAKSLADALDEVYDLRSRAAKMATYGILLDETDIRSAIVRTRYDVGTAIEIEVEPAVEFVEEEVRAIGAERLAAWLREEPRLERHRRRINRILFEAPHSLGREAQAIVESMARWPRIAADAFSTLHESPLGWPTIKSAAGEDVVVDLAAFSRLRRSADRGEREGAARAFLNRLGEVESVFGLMLTRRIEADLTIARHRKFDDGIEAIWYLRDGMPRGSHRVMIDVARRNLPTLRRYVDLRRRALGLDRFAYGDFFVTPPGIARSFTIDEAMEIAVAASAPLGAEYQARLRARLKERWMHLPPLPEKRDTFAVFPPVGGIAPYFILTYQPTFRLSRTFAGGATIMMTFADLPRDRMPDTRDDPPAYGNGVIYVGNMLHDDYLARSAKDRRERIAYLVHQLDLIWQQYFRWVLVSELDAAVQAMIANGATPTGSQVSKMYLDLLRQYYGDAVDVDDSFAREWMTFSVPFLSYEHQFWPPAMAGACAIFERLQKGDATARRFDQVQGRGELDLSYHLFKQIGVDMATPAPYEAVIRRMERLESELARELGGI
jgi:oligoendopeptidase F